MTDAETPIETMSYEKALQALEQIVDALESEQQPLEQVIALYERGQALARRCSRLLDAADLRIHQLSENGLALTEITPER